MITLEAVQNYEKWGHRRPRTWLAKYGALNTTMLCDGEKQWWNDYKECRVKAEKALPKQSICSDHVPQYRVWAAV